MTWPDDVSVNPDGKEPDRTDQVYGFVPPVAPKVAEYKELAIPTGNEFVVIFKGTTALRTEPLRFFDAVCD